MEASPNNPSPTPDPYAEYRQRREQFQVQHDQLERQLAWLGNSRFALFIAGIVLLGLSLGVSLFHPLWLIVPFGLFVGLSTAFGRAWRRSQYVKRALAFYDYGLARLADSWAGGGTTGAAYLDDSHPYAADLDLFGVGSLFERL
jgi:hypothetical protein